MLRRLLACAVLALMLAPSALADGGTAGVTQGWDGVAAPGTPTPRRMNRASVLFVSRLSAVCGSSVG